MMSDEERAALSLAIREGDFPGLAADVFEAGWLAHRAYSREQEPSDADIERAAKALYTCDEAEWDWDNGNNEWFRGEYESRARAALKAARER